MEYRTLGRTDWQVSTVSFGAWAIGGTWGAVTEDESMGALHRALDRGVNFFDTADVYGDGRLRAAAGPAAARAQGSLLRHDQGGPPAPQADRRGLQQEEPDRLRRPQPQEPGGRDHRPPAAALPADRPLLPPRGVRPARRSGEGRQDSLLRRQRRAGRRGAEGDRVPGRAVGAAHLQHLPPAPGRPVLRARRAGARSASWRGCRCRRGCWPGR